MRLFLSGLFLLNWQTAIKNNFAFEVGAAMADYITSPLEWTLTQTAKFCAQNSLSISLSSRRSAFLLCATKVDLTRPNFLANSSEPILLGKS